MSIKSIWLEGRLASFSYQHGQSSKHVTGLLNNGCLLKTVNYGGERGARGTTPLSSFTPKEDGSQVRLG